MAVLPFHSLSACPTVVYPTWLCLAALKYPQLPVQLPLPFLTFFWLMSSFGLTILQPKLHPLKWLLPTYMSHVSCSYHNYEKFFKKHPLPPKNLCCITGRYSLFIHYLLPQFKLLSLTVPKYTRKNHYDKLPFNPYSESEFKPLSSLSMSHSYDKKICQYIILIFGIYCSKNTLIVTYFDVRYSSLECPRFYLICRSELKKSKTDHNLHIMFQYTYLTNSEWSDERFDFTMMGDFFLCLCTA
ncbi:hypothetical protein AGLY_000945 [Aphis glycines]|uniref:Uncharacterized protein n=1 Tax=Aphis glycines TaxID=307491 RepID=A0A6G0UAR8_APHGL|nr:hypothetical protein AGLY_000945 [Aphis glycines]